MPRKYRHIKDDEKKLIEYKTGNRPLFYYLFSDLDTPYKVFEIVKWLADSRK